MKPEARKQLSWIVAIVPLGFLWISSVATKVTIGACEAMIRDRHITSLPGPTRLLLDHRVLASAFPMVLALAFVAFIWFIKRRSTDEATSLTMQLTVHAILWFIAVNYFVGVMMAAFLPLGIPANH